MSRQPYSVLPISDKVIAAQQDIGLSPDVDPRAVVSDKVYASRANRRAARDRGAIPVIPHKSNEKDKPAFLAKAL